MRLRPYQREAIAASVDERRHGVWAQLCVLGTGAGKTVIFGHLPVAHGVKWGEESVVVLCHMDELVWQAAEKMKQCNPGCAVGVEKADHHASPHVDILVASVPSLIRDRLKRFPPERFRMVIHDESHTALADSPMAVFRHFQVLKGENPDTSKLLYGTSATVRRSDNRGLEKIFQKIVYEKGVLPLVREGWLAEPRAWRICTESSIAEVPVTRAGELEESGLSIAINTPARNRVIVDNYLEKGGGYPALAFTVDVQHAVDLAKQFRDNGVEAWPLSGATPRDERKRLFEAHRDGEIKVLASCAVLGLGVDLPAATVGLYARPFRNSLPLIQQVGRIMRPYPSPEDREAGYYPRFIKPYALHLDFVDNFGRHSIRSIPSLFGLRFDFDPQGRSIPEVIAELEEMNLDLQSVTSVEQARHFAEMVDLMGEPAPVPVEIRDSAKLNWVQAAEGTFRLQRPKDKSFLELRINVLGGVDLSVSKHGNVTPVKGFPSFARAVKYAEAMVPRWEKRMISVGGDWRNREPSLMQIQMLYGRDRENIRKKFSGLKEFSAFVLSEHNRGNHSWSRGGVSDRINMLTVAK